MTALTDEAGAVLERLRLALDEQWLAAHIDNPVEAALSGLLHSAPPANGSFHGFVDWVSRVMQILHKSRGLRLAAEMAYAEGSHLLDIEYPGGCFTGSEAAFAAWREGQTGIALVIAECLARGIVRELRNCAQNVAVQRWLSPGNWAIRMEFAYYLKAQHSLDSLSVDEIAVTLEQWLPHLLV